MNWYQPWTSFLAMRRIFPQPSGSRSKASVKISATCRWQAMRRCCGASPSSTQPQAHRDYLRTAHTATKNDWGAIALYQDKMIQVPQRPLEILDRVGGGDSFASGMIYGLLAGKDIQWALECGVAHGALAMTTPGDTSMATLSEVEAVMRGGSARIAR